MTRERAIQIMSNYDLNFHEVNEKLFDYGEVAEAFDMAIQTLEQQPCDDCISREAVMKCFKKWQPYMATRLLDYEQELKELPSVTPKIEQQPCEDVLEKIKTEVLDEAEYAYADFDRYKEDILHAESDELPDDDFRYGLERAVEIINKYMAESEE